ncbi:Ca2+-binding EF-hand superfamily protein [Streptosporangium becharense]|uniref:Ca2+-binding EF-hand superfamily protein n=1 Tax=Streptosporangium becharense TaxID=1816182 RepID=A0A7W9IHK0_9ACTN|nr:EF-hand domain-containing protein [Streptosporangium becharense]MBB2914692.1 Ca2+-binding EF-hand superfamily protein [Streptosporangium becharense]MBB5820907.1 Ca2+-binding EF-hand superfamily protein [Streptosporangium becharense]
MTDDYATTFRIVDVDGDGLISVVELSRLMEVLGQPLSPEAAAAAVASIDRDGDGLISQEEFAGYLARGRTIG